MKRLVLICIFLLIAVAWCVAQTDKPACPKIRVIGPHGISNPGDTITFVADVSGNESSIKYEWTVDQGTIVEGQGTPAIFVTSRKGDTNIKATVRIDGIPSFCENSASEMASIARLPEWCAMDSWEILKPNHERDRLDSFFLSLQDNPTNSGLILLVVTDKEKLDPTNHRIKFFINHAKFRKFDLRRLVFSLESSGSSGVRSTAVYRFPPGAEPPCDNCVLIYGRDLR
jgi:hypothetical protein